MKSDEEIANELYDKWCQKYPMVKMLGKGVKEHLLIDIRSYTLPFRQRIHELEKKGSD